MPRFVKDDQVIETSNAVEGARLRASGFAEQAARTAEVRKADAENAPEPEANKAAPAKRVTK